jgi:hypothetical protein
VRSNSRAAFQLTPPQKAGGCGWFLALAVFFATQTCSAARGNFFQIQVVDAATGRGVPLVELETVNRAQWWTDSNGIIAFDEPGLMGLEIFFHVRSPGYEVSKDFFGNRGVKLKPVAGEKAVVKITRLNIAERLYRITGQGIYRDSVRVGHPVPLKHPILNGQVLGQDTVIATPYHGKIYWFWGDTDRPGYPLGNFGASGATSELPGHGGLDPSVGVDLTYFVDGSGFSKPMCPEPHQGPRWIESLLTVPDERGVERLVARVENVKDLSKAYGWHVMLFNDGKQIFESIQRWDIDQPHRSAHPFRARVDGREFYYIFPDFRVPAEFKALQDPGAYETYTCISGDGKWHGRETEIERDAAGHPRYTWKSGAGHPSSLEKLMRGGKLKREESWCFLRDFETGAPLTRGLESVAWNQFRRRWIGFFADKPGEAWFAEADTPLGPWGYGRRVLTHGDYNFYNIAHHSFFDQEGGRLVYFEGTYTSTFSKADTTGKLTPRYNYNQLMYRLALDDPRLALPVAVYRMRGTNGVAGLALRERIETAGAWDQIGEVAWFAFPPGAPNREAVAVHAENGRLAMAPPFASKKSPLFCALPLAQAAASNTVAGSWEFRAILPGDEEFKAELALSITNQGELKVEGFGEDASCSGTYRDGKLLLTVKTENESFVLEGSYKEDALAGQWRKQGSDEKGKWSASRMNTSTSEFFSPALAVLKEYRRRGGGLHEYSIGPAPAGCEEEGKPLCRVWKVPGQVLTCDWKAKPDETTNVEPRVK